MKYRGMTEAPRNGDEAEVLWDLLVEERRENELAREMSTSMEKSIKCERVDDSSKKR